MTPSAMSPGGALFDRYYTGHRWTRDLLWEWIEASIGPSANVLVAGAGPHEGFPLKGRVARLVGIDIDDAVLGNESLDEAHVTDGEHFPLPSGSFDIVLSDYVFEHLADPPSYFSEVARVLKPGGRFVFRTVNANHYLILPLRWMPPLWRHTIANRFQPRNAHDQDHYPTYLRANTFWAIPRLLKGSGLCVGRFCSREEPPLFFRSAAMLWLPAVAYQRWATAQPAMAPFRITLYGWARKPGLSPGNAGRQTGL